MIDMHTHAFSEEIAERAVKKLAENSNVEPFLNGTLEDLSKSTRNAELEYSIVAPIATKPSQVRTINIWALDIHKKYNNLIGFGTLHPHMENPEKEVEWLLENKFKGIKVHPDYQMTLIDDPKFMKIHKALAKAGLILLTHAGYDIGLPPPRHCNPKNLAKVMDTVPDLTIIAAHMGGIEEQEDVEKYYFGRNIYLDTCYTHHHINGNQLAKKIKSHGVDKILFGTDSPWSDQKEQINYIKSLPLLTEKEKNMVLEENAKRLLKL